MTDPRTPVVHSATTNQTLGILSLIGGILSLVFGQTIVLPVVAIVLGFMARNREPASRSYAFWGILLSFIALFGWIIVIVIVLLASAFSLPFLLTGN